MCVPDTRVAAISIVATGASVQVETQYSAAGGTQGRQDGERRIMTVKGYTSVERLRLACLSAHCLYTFIRACSISQKAEEPAPSCQ